MKALVLWMLLQAPAAPPQVAPQPEPAKAAVQPFAGTLREGRIELARLSKAEKHEEAQALAAALAAKPDFDAQPEAERAEVLYAIGVVHGRALQLPEAIESFHRARGLAGSSELGRASAYNAGTYLLLGAEQVREQIPEIREKLKLPPLDPAQSFGLAAPGGAGDAGEQAPDPLEIARQAYLAARAELLAAWRGDRASSDVRANLELCVRRLRELDELERQREEQKQEQQNEKQDPNQKQDPQQGDQQQDQQDPQQQDSKQDPKDPQQDDASKDGEKNEPKPQDEKKPDESEPKKDPGAQADEAKQEERPLSAEEMQRLLQQLQQIDEKAKEIEALLRERRRQPVKKDW